MNTQTGEMSYGFASNLRGALPNVRSKSGMAGRRDFARAHKDGNLRGVKMALNIPDATFRQAKARAALRGVSLRQFVTEALEQKLSAPAASRSGSTEPPWMQGFGALADLHEETRLVEARIEEAFEGLDDEERS